MRIIFEILMNAVIDGEAMDAALAAIDAGPYVDRLDETTPDVTTLEREEMHYYLVARTRHHKDFEPFWRGGSPKRHRLLDEHPEWFTRDSSGAITGVYTQALTWRTPGFSATSSTRPWLSCSGWASKVTVSTSRRTTT